MNKIKSCRIQLNYIVEKKFKTQIYALHIWYVIIAKVTSKYKKLYIHMSELIFWTNHTLSTTIAPLQCPAP